VTLTVRTAQPSDLDAIARMTAANRRRLAAWSPLWWRPAQAADQIHPLWLQHLIVSEGPVVRVAEHNGEVVGCIASTQQPHTWFIDDLAVTTEDRWADVGAALIEAVAERPAMTCASPADQGRLAALGNAGLAHVSDYWIRETAAGEPKTLPIPAGAAIPAPAPHTFGGPFDPHAPGALAFTTDDGGMVIGSPSITAPPVYDPGGTTCIIDRLLDATDALVDTAIAAAGQRGAGAIAVVVAATDSRLQSILAGHGFQRTVAVYRWA
jgi:ribosomal protein S18 acetylase RimI-like enzyme